MTQEEAATIRHSPFSARSRGCGQPPFCPFLNFGLLGDFQRVIDVDTRVANHAFQFVVPEQSLYRADDPGAPADQNSFGAAHGVRAISRRLKSDSPHPVTPNSREFGFRTFINDAVQAPIIVTFHAPVDETLQILIFVEHRLSVLASVQ